MTGSITKSVPEIFQTMLEMEAVACDPEEAKPSKTTNQIVGSISMSGTIQGRLNLYVTEEFSRRMTAAMLGDGTGRDRKHRGGERRHW